MIHVRLDNRRMRLERACVPAFAPVTGFAPGIASALAAGRWNNREAGR